MNPFLYLRLKTRVSRSFKTTHFGTELPPTELCLRSEHRNTPSRGPLACLLTPPHPLQLAVLPASLRRKNVGKLGPPVHRFMVNSSVCVRKMSRNQTHRYTVLWKIHPCSGKHGGNRSRRYNVLRLIPSRTEKRRGHSWSHRYTDVWVMRPGLLGQKVLGNRLGNVLQQ